MDFRLSKEQVDIQKAAREFAEGEFDADLAFEYDQGQRFPSLILKKACALGFVGVHFPECCGGQGLGLVENALITEAFCRKDSGIGTALAFSDFGSDIIVRYGEESQKEKMLALVAEKGGVITIGFQEEGQCIRSFSTRATKSGDQYTLNGRKLFVSMGELADYIVVICGTESNMQAAFAVDKNINGVHVEPKKEKLGMRMIPSNNVLLNNVVVSTKELIGKEDKGHELGEFLDCARIEMGAMAVGIAQGALDRALDYSKKRSQFGKTIISFDAIKNKLANMCMEVEMTRLVVYKAAVSVDQGIPDKRCILISKMMGSKTAYDVTNHAIQIHGGYGYMTESIIERFYRDAKALGLFLDPSQAQVSNLVDEIASLRH